MEVTMPVDERGKPPVLWLPGTPLFANVMLFKSFA